MDNEISLLPASTLEHTSECEDCRKLILALLLSDLSMIIAQGVHKLPDRKAAEYITYVLSMIPNSVGMCRGFLRIEDAKESTTECLADIMAKAKGHKHE